VNGVEFDTRGNIWVAQARLTMRTDSGIQFPLSVTASNRSELLAHERDIRGSVGITFDLDKLFARAGQ
jgi:ligand-binding sensor domain-containing protein